MAQKAKTAQKASATQKLECPECSSELRVVRYAGFGPKGLFWVCEKNCGYMRRTR